MTETYATEIRVAEGGVVVNLICACGQELGADYHAIEPTEIDQPRSLKLMTALRTRLAGGCCPTCHGTIAPLEAPIIDERTSL